MTTQVHARHILVSTEQAADEVIELLNKKEDFGKLAMEKSSCPSREDGGDLGWFGKGVMVPAFEKKCFEMKKGEVSKVKTNFGWHVIRVEETK